ncbi:MAG: hypothetical protein LIO90_04445 [Bacteroidales bacterium]|nr:hypothetical protein [Bacteroidales bacterium]
MILDDFLSNHDLDLDNSHLGGDDSFAFSGNDMDDTLWSIPDDMHNLLDNIIGGGRDDLDASSAEDHNYADQVSFGGKYSKDEIARFEHDVEMAKNEMDCRKSDVRNWEQKVSLNDTKEHRANGDYANAVSHLNDAKSRYNYAADRYNHALSKLNNAR